MQGDAKNLLAAFDDDIEFRLSENHPYQPSGQPWIGKDAITRHFLMGELAYRHSPYRRGGQHGGRRRAVHRLLQTDRQTHGHAGLPRVDGHER
jgi:hypothetical protein